MAHNDDIVTLLRQVDLFQDVETAALQLIAQRTTEETFSNGDVVFDEGDFGDRLFLLISGTMRVYVERDGTIITYAILDAGQCFGEIALIVDTSRSATVRAETAARCLTLTKQGFNELLSQHAPVALGLLKSLCQRLRQANSQLQAYAALGPKTP